jgi:hypothetical protein
LRARDNAVTMMPWSEDHSTGPKPKEDNMVKPKREHRERAVVHQLMPAEPGIVAIFASRIHDTTQEHEEREDYYTLERDVIGWAIYDVLTDAYVDGELRERAVEKERRIGAIVMGIGDVPVPVEFADDQYLRLEKQGRRYGERWHRNPRPEPENTRHDQCSWIDNDQPEDDAERGAKPYKTLPSPRARRGPAPSSATPTPRLRGLVERVVDLARAYRQAYEEARGDEPTWRARRATLEHFVDALDPTDAVRIHTLMYVGRDKEDGTLGKWSPGALRRNLRETAADDAKKPNERITETILEKVPLDSYLVSGLALVDEIGFDLENDW